jgi:hypothetical protein
MGNYIGKVAAVFTANTSGLVAGTREATAALTKMEGNVKSISTGMNALVAIQGAQLFAGVARSAADAAGSFIRMNAATAELIDAQSKMARKIGVSLADFQSLALAGDLAGVSQEKMAASIGKMGIALVKAEQGSRQAQSAFASLGLSVDELGKMGAADQFNAISVAIGKLPTPAEQAAAAVRIFGKGGKDLLDIFANGGEAVKQAAEYAELFGTALSTEAGQSVEKMVDDFGLLGEVVKGFKTQLVAAFAPAVSEQIAGVIEKIKELGGIKSIAQDTAIFLAEAGGKFIDAGTIFASKIDAVLTALDKSVSVIGALGQGALGIGQTIAAGTQQVGAVISDVVNTDQRDPGSKAAAAAEYKRAEELAKSGSENVGGFFDWLNGKKPAEREEPTAGSRFAAATRAAVERENAAAAERERARQAAAAATPQPSKVASPERSAPPDEPPQPAEKKKAVRATDSKRSDGIRVGASDSSRETGKTLHEQLAALKEVAANTAKQAVFTVFNIPGAGAR